METIGDRVRRLREAKGIERKHLARDVGLSYSGLSDLESGKAKSSTKLHRLAARLDVSTIYLETGKDRPDDGDRAAPSHSQPLRLDPDILSETARTLRERFGDDGMFGALIEHEPLRFIEAYELYANHTRDKRTPELERALVMKIADLTPQGAKQDERGTTVPTKGAARREVGKTGGRKA